MMIEPQWDGSLGCLKTRDPRRTKSVTDLHLVSVKDIAVKRVQEKVDEALTSLMAEEDFSKAAKPGLILDETWFTVRDDERFLLNQAKDDLDMSLHWKNLQLINLGPGMLHLD